MSAYVANLKTWYQCKPLWLWHLLGAVIYIPTIVRAVDRADEGLGFSFGILLVTFWLGTITAFLAKDIQIRPFTFCLPGHGAVSRRVTFTVGVGASAICSLVFLVYPTATAGETLAAMWSALTLGVIAYFAALFVTRALTRASLLPTMIALLLTFSFHDEVTVNLRVAAERTALGLPVETGLLAALVVMVAWRMMGSRRLARKNCGESYLPPYCGLNVSRLMAYERETGKNRFKRMPHRFMEFLGRFFISRMGKSPRRTSRTLIWGTLYHAAGNSAPVTLTNFLLLFLAFLVLTVVLGYHNPPRFPPGVSVVNLLVFGLYAGIGQQQINTLTGFLLPVSRRNRFMSLLYAAFAYTFSAAVLGVLIMAASGVVDRFAHEVVFAGRSFTYSPVILDSLLFFPSMLPLCYAVQILFPKYYIVPLVIIASAYAPAYIIAIEEFGQMSALGVAVFHAICWLPFVLLAHHSCYSSDLILKGK